MNPKAFVLADGSRVLAEVVNENETGVLVRNPLIYGMVSTEKGPMVQFAEFAPEAEGETFTFSHDYIRTQFNVNDQLNAKYGELYGTIITPSTNVQMLNS